MGEAIERFSSRVDDYVKYRPTYPSALFDTLERECGLDAPSVVADIGSGTGIATAPLLARGHRVLGVEPNPAMREAAERSLANVPNAALFTSVAGRAEATGLADQCVDLVLCAQAFHWFDRDACRREFARILSPGGSVALIWNDRSRDATPFLAAYEELLRALSIDYDEVNNQDAVSDSALAEFFAPSTVIPHSSEPVSLVGAGSTETITRSRVFAYISGSASTRPHFAEPKIAPGTSIRS